LLVAVQLFVAGLYLPPVSNVLLSSVPPRRSSRRHSKQRYDSIAPLGVLVVLVAVHVFAVGVVSPPLFKYRVKKSPKPPQTIISVASPDCRMSNRGSGTLFVLVAVQLSAPGLYFAPVSNPPKPLYPPRQSFTPSPHGSVRVSCSGAFVRLVAASYQSPVRISRPCLTQEKNLAEFLPRPPFQLPVQTAL